MPTVTGIRKGVSYSLKEFDVHPQHSTADFSPETVDLTGRLALIPGTKNEFLTIKRPFVSAAMQAIIGFQGRSDMAPALAIEGGFSVVPRSIPKELGASIIEKTKAAQGGFQTMHAVSPNMTLEELTQTMVSTRFSKFPVTEDGKANGKLLGLITDDMFNPDKLDGLKVRDIMRGYVMLNRQGDAINDTRNGDQKREGYTPRAVLEGINLKQAGNIMVRYATGFLMVVDKHGNMKSGIFKKDRDRHVLYYPFESLDNNKKYMVGGAVSTHIRDHSRIELLIKAHADAIFIDASHGDTDYQISTLKFIRKKYPGMPVICGNVVTYKGAMRLFIEGEKYGGISGVKVGQGTGSGCTTTDTTGIGRGLASALREVYKARNEYYRKTGNYIPIIGDGGIFTGQEITVALAFADAVMMGKFFARFTESAADIAQNGMKEYWMEASRRARNIERYDMATMPFFPQGKEGYVPHVGSIHTLDPRQPSAFDEAVSAIKVSLWEAGCRNIYELHKPRTILEWRSPTSQIESGASGILLKD